ncbi:MAG: VapC toxin family PIN domain ribonuclease [Proteobacteria bacterium]|nr:VapC toxin family PIN domain ribonuclease [Pseudomonadota bacterium]
MAGVLADTSIWVAHFRQPNSRLAALLADDQVYCHPLVLIEIACGSPPAPRHRTLADLRSLCQTTIATSDEILALVEREQMYNSGCGAVDAALLAATLLTPGTRLWTVDRPLAAIAQRLGVAFQP